VEQDDPIATRHMGFLYKNGENGLLQNRAKALELWHRAGELGSAEAYYNIGNSYRFGVEVDMKKATYYWEQAAIKGDAIARFNLGATERNAGNIDRALKHFLIAVKSGEVGSLKIIKRMYKIGQATKDDYAKALRLHQEYLDEVKSNQRDEAAAFNVDWEYYGSAV